MSAPIHEAAIASNERCASIRTDLNVYPRKNMNIGAPTIMPKATFLVTSAIIRMSATARPMNSTICHVSRETKSGISNPIIPGTINSDKNFFSTAEPISW